MHTTIGMIVLNEEEYIWKNLQQHYQYADKIVIVEGADQLYPRDRVSTAGLSTDNTAELVRSFPDPDHKILFIQHGWCQMAGPQAKCELRNRYLQETPPGILVVIDADEFYRHRDLHKIISEIRLHQFWTAYQIPQIHFWRNTEQFITGGYYDVPHCRFWRVQAGDSYLDNHNYPSRKGVPLRNLHVRIKRRRIVRDRQGYHCVDPPVCYHFGFVKKSENVLDKTRYYENRGEKQTRPNTHRSRMAWFRSDGMLASDRLTVYNYGGLLPECFEEKAKDSIDEGLGAIVATCPNA